MFENDVKTYGTQATSPVITMSDVFENDVKTYGTQARAPCLQYMWRLRMM